MPDYPAPPWHMHGDLWLSLFRLTRADHRHPAGWYGVALVDYQPPSPLTYGELLVARPTETAAGKRAVTVTDIWVDCPASVAGGRELWAIPKGLCDFELDTHSRGPFTRTRWSATVDGRTAARARFADLSRAAPRLPSSGRIVQPGIDDHPEPGSALMKGSAKSMPCRGRWEFDADGPLAFLRGARQLGSFRMADFRLSFA